MTRTYKLFTATPATGDAKAQLKIVRKGTITSIIGNISGVSAGITSCTSIELSKAPSSQFTTNDTPATTLAYMVAANPVNGSAGSACQIFNGIRIPVDVGDTLYLHVKETSTQTTSGHSWLIYCDE